MSVLVENLTKTFSKLIFQKQRSITTVPVVGRDVRVGLNSPVPDRYDSDSFISGSCV